MNRFILWKLKRTLRKFNRENKRLRRKYCHTGHHKLRKHTTGWTMNKRNTTIEYLKCAYCQYMFFASFNQKKLYLRRSKEFNSSAKEAFSALYSHPSCGKSKDFNTSGRCDAGNLRPEKKGFSKKTVRKFWGR